MNFKKIFNFKELTIISFIFFSIIYSTSFHYSNSAPNDTFEPAQFLVHTSPKDGGDTNIPKYFPDYGLLYEKLFSNGSWPEEFHPRNITGWNDMWKSSAMAVDNAYYIMYAGYYAGLIEGLQVFDGNIDVIVCDGFVGNVLLKASEALFSFVGTTIKHELSKNYQRKIGAALSKAAFDDMRSRLSPDQHAGAPLLGLKGNILKSHGSSNYIAIGNALRIARELVMHDMIDSIQSDINQANRIISNHQENNPR